MPIFIVTSGKGGVGKTTVAACLGAKLAQKGKRTVVCDFDIGLNNLDIVMGVEKNVQFDLCDALEGRCRATQALVPCSVKNLFMISSAHSSSQAMDSLRIKNLLDGLKSNYEYIFIDCPAGIDIGFHRAARAADCALVVVTPSLSSLRDADKTLSVLRSYNIKKIFVVVNMVRGDLAVDGLTLSVREVEEVLGTEVAGVIPFDDWFLTAENCIIPDGSTISTCFRNLATVITGGRKRIYDFENDYIGIIGSIKRRLKKSL